MKIKKKIAKNAKNYFKTQEKKYMVEIIFSDL